MVLTGVSKERVSQSVPFLCPKTETSEEGGFMTSDTMGKRQQIAQNFLRWNTRVLPVGHLHGSRLRSPLYTRERRGHISPALFVPSKGTRKRETEASRFPSTRRLPSARAGGFRPLHPRPPWRSHPSSLIRLLLPAPFIRKNGPSSSALGGSGFGAPAPPNPAGCGRDVPTRRAREWSLRGGSPGCSRGSRASPCCDSPSGSTWRSGTSCRPG